MCLRITCPPLTNLKVYWACSSFLGLQALILYLLTIRNGKLSEMFCTRLSLFLNWSIVALGVSKVTLVVKNPPANAGDVRDAGSIPRLGRFPGEGNGNQLQCLNLENPMDRGTWWATVHGVTVGHD